MAPPSASVTFETFAADLARLVDRFDRQHPVFTSPDYNEATLRADFLDPFFRALGWDVGNQKGLIHTEREVDIEVRTTTSGRQTRADYVFRFQRTDRFTCEAKKPAEPLHDGHIFQAKRDAFNRGIPLALLSDFEELKIFIVGARPSFSEPHTGEWKVLHFRQYPEAARELWDLLAYENVAAGSIDRLIDSLPKRPLKLKGRQGYIVRPDRTRALDSDFLNFLDSVRQQLGSDLLKHNDRADLLQGHRLNEAAQRIIDRLVFLRICEDRGIDTGTLLETLFNGWYRQQPESRRPRLRKVSHQTNLRFGSAAEEDPGEFDAGRAPTEGGLYRELTEHIRALDQRPPSYKPFFNGQLFKPHFSEDLVVGNEWLANFVLDLTAPDSHYNFADIKVEILGDAYERFLGHILVPKGRGTAIEAKPEVRKAGGVYYTPRYITDYIVEQTIGRLLKGKTPKEVEKLRFLDPACGSGSFLIRAYERTMEHYLRYFTAHPGKRRADDCFVDAAGNVRLTTALKRRILENNIYGVDIDAQAVEVTQLSLYLKMLEGENRDTLRQQTELFRGEALLPALDRNIKCFNSLIGSDFSLDPAELVRVNAGDWDVQFEAVMRAGGFDAVVGNPPYVRSRHLDQETKEYLGRAYAAGSYQPDLFAFFLERGATLLSGTGRLSFIVPNGILTNTYYAALRRWLLEQTAIEIIVDLKDGVFADAAVDTSIFVVASCRDAASRLLNQVRIGEHPAAKLRTVETPVSTRSQSSFLELPELALNTGADAGLSLLNEKLRRTGAALGEQFIVKAGMKVRKDFVRPTKEDLRFKKFLLGSDISRFAIGWRGYWVCYDKQLESRFSNQAFRDEVIFTAPEKILVRQVLGKEQIIATFDAHKNYADQSLYVLVPKLPATECKFVLGILNSRLMGRFFSTSSGDRKKTFPKIKGVQIEALPIAHPTDSLHNRLVALVDKMLALTPALRTAKSDAEKATLQNAIRKTDRDIDQLVYQLYGLTPEEIALVEGTAASTPPLPAGSAD